MLMLQLKRALLLLFVNVRAYVNMCVLPVPVVTETLDCSCSTVAGLQEV